MTDRSLEAIKAEIEERGYAGLESPLLDIIAELQKRLKLELPGEMG